MPWQRCPVALPGGDGQEGRSYSLGDSGSLNPDALRTEEAVELATGKEIELVATPEDERESSWRPIVGDRDGSTENGLKAVVVRGSAEDPLCRRWSMTSELPLR